MLLFLSGNELHDAEQQQDECERGDEARRDHVLGLQALRVRLVVRALPHAEEAPEDRLERVHHDRAGISKNVYEIEIVSRSAGASLLTRKTTGISLTSPAPSLWSVKQKHSRFSIHRAAAAGAVFMTACAVTGRPSVLATR